MAFKIDSIAEGKDGYVIGFRPVYPVDPAAPIEKYKVHGIVSLLDSASAEITMRPDYAGCDDSFIYISSAALTAGAESVLIRIDDNMEKLVFADDGEFTAQVGDATTTVLE